jgi:hypothetical protein
VALHEQELDTAWLAFHSSASATPGSTPYDEPSVTINGPSGVVPAPGLTISWASSVTIVGQDADPDVTLSKGSVTFSNSVGTLTMSSEGAVTGLVAAGGLRLTQMA